MTAAKPDADLIAACGNALQTCLALRPTESLLVLTDAGCRELGDAFAAAGEKLAREVIYVVIPVGAAPGAEPPPAAAAAMRHCDVAVCPTTKSITHTAARRAACANGARVASMPGATRDTLVRCLSADYDEVAAVTHRVAERLTAARVAHLTCPHGTDLRLPLEGIAGIPSTGLIREPGQGGNLPSGEAYLRPREGESEGVLYIDGSMAGVGVIGAVPLRLRIEGGRAVEITGGPEAAKLTALLEPHGERARNVAELGVGTNPAARIIGLVLEDEKVAGTVHVALGNNIGMGGTVDVPIHLDGVLRRPTLVTDDGTALVEDGRLLVRPD